MTPMVFGMAQWNPSLPLAFPKYDCREVLIGIMQRMRFQTACIKKPGQLVYLTIGASSTARFNESNASTPIINVAMSGAYFEPYIVQSAAASIGYWMLNPTWFAIEVVAA
jgi:hypothetical protein